MLPVPMAQLCEGCWVAGTLPIPHTSLMVVPLPPLSPPKSMEAKLWVQEGHRDGAITATQGQWGSNAALFQVGCVVERQSCFLSLQPPAVVSAARLPVSCSAQGGNGELLPLHLFPSL